MKFELLILGISSAAPAFGRHQTSQLVNHNNKLFLVDCGEGAQMQLMKYGVKFQKINHIFISHLHGDHFFGLPGLISTLHLQGRTKKLHLYGPRGLDEILLTNFRQSDSRLNYLLEFHPIDTERQYVLFENHEIQVLSIPLNHGTPCSGFLFREKTKLRKIISEKIPANISFEQYDHLRNGEDITVDKKVYRNTELTTAPEPPRTFAYCSDTRYYEGFEQYIQGAKTLYHETTFLENLKDRAIRTNHTTAKEAGQLASKINAGKLIIGHFSARYKDLSPILAESKKEFNNSYLAKEGLTFQI